ncbi:MarR family transcriptional regulator [Treponema sp. Marseille-Q3903]|nr:MarR family transcriptional regulator [Treponema sp. Marseille-Q3903]
MTMDIKSSISLLSHIHSITADFLIEKLKEKGFPEFASSHGNILFQLSIKSEMTMGELSEKINRDKSTTTVLVRKLERDGLVCRNNDENDKRNRLISLTEKGKEFNSAINAISKELIETFYKGFSEEEKKQFFEFLKRIDNNFSS